MHLARTESSNCENQRKDSKHLHINAKRLVNIVNACNKHFPPRHFVMKPVLPY